MPPGFFEISCDPLRSGTGRRLAAAWLRAFPTSRSGVRRRDHRTRMNCRLAARSQSNDYSEDGIALANGSLHRLGAAAAIKNSTISEECSLNYNVR